MTDKEAEFFRWMEALTIMAHTETLEFEPSDPADERLAFALSRGYVKRLRGRTAHQITDIGWEWFAVRAARIMARCNAGNHDMAAKTPYCVGLHCRWCGEPDAERCQECERFFLSGTVEGGWKTPIAPSYESHPRSTIHHGQEKR